MTKNQRNTPLACIILAAGQGTRMLSDKAKVLHEIAGFPMITHVINACRAINPEKIIVTIAPDMNEVKEIAQPYHCVVQEKQLGTGDAVKSSISELEGFNGDVLVVFGDTPLLTGESLDNMVKFKSATNVDLVVSGFVPNGNHKYGRIIHDEDGKYVKAIIEDADANEEQKEIRICNGGLMLFGANILPKLLSDLKSNNAQEEYYLTDCVALANSKGLKVAAAHLSQEDVRGVNTRVQLAEVESIMQMRLRAKHMLNGVTMHDPMSVYLCLDTKIEKDVTIEPNVVFGRNVEIKSGALIRAFSHIEGAIVEENAQIGPYARLRPDAKIGKSARIGNFVEIKKSVISDGAKINHLSYIGDAFVGEKTNIGAGTITCNYDGYIKSKTTIGSNAFIGSNTIMIAPVSVGDGAITAAGSIITKDVCKDSLAVSRSSQKSYDNWAKKFRQKKEKS